MVDLTPRKITIRCPKCAYDVGTLEGKIVRCSLCGDIWTASAEELQRGRRAADEHPWKELFNRPEKARYYNRVSPVKSGRFECRLNPPMAAILNACIADLGINKTEIFERALTYYFSNLKRIREAEGRALGDIPEGLALPAGDD